MDLDLDIDSRKLGEIITSDALDIHQVRYLPSLFLYLAHGWIPDLT
jgi:hypothetical protein